MKRQLFVITVALLAQAPAPAATITYNSNTSGSSLATASNWNPSTAVPGTGDEALFTTAAPANLVTTGANSIFGDLIWGTNNSATVSINTTGSTNRTLTLSGNGGATEATARGGSTGDLLLLGNSATSNTLTFAGNTSTGTARLSLILGANGNFNVVNSGATLDIAVVVSGAFNLAKTGSGALTLSGVNSFGGSGKTFTLNAGTLNINNAAALGSSSNVFVINGGTINNTSGGSITTSNQAQNWNGDFTFTGSNALNLGNGAVALGANRQVTVSASTLTVGGAISGGGFSLAKAGAGTLELSGNNTYSGGTTVNGGTLAVSHASALGNGAATVNPGGTLHFNGVSTTNAIVLNSGTLTASGASFGTSGDVSGSGTIGSSLTLASFSTLISGIGANTALTLAGSSALTLATLNLSFAANMAPDQGNSLWNSSRSWTIVDGTSGSITGTALGTGSSGYGNGSFSLSTASNDLTLNWTATAIPEPSTYAAILGGVALVGVMIRRCRRQRAA